MLSLQPHIPFYKTYSTPHDDERWSKKRNKKPTRLSRRTVVLGPILLLSVLLLVWTTRWGNTPHANEERALRERREELEMWKRVWTENERTKQPELEEVPPANEKLGWWPWFSNTNGTKKDTSDNHPIRKKISPQSRKYLIFMPWEQLNNQLIEFRCACATAHILNRTLVLPKIGYRKDPADWNFSYDVRAYQWKDFENYFRTDDQVVENLPCDIVTNEEFRKVVLSWRSGLGDLRFNPVASATNREQLRDYYENVLHLPYSQIVDGPREYQLSRSQILSKYAPDHSRVLALGSLFWFYDFESPQEYPLKSYADLTQHPMYSSIVKGTLVQWDVEMVAEIVVRALGGDNGFDAMHVRRGDYWKKCSGISNLELRAKCYPSNSDLVAKAEEAERMGNLHEMKHPSVMPYRSQPKLASSLPPSPSRRHLYLSTNIPGRDAFGAAIPEFSQLESPGRRIYFAADILGQPYVPLQAELELVQMAKTAWRKFDPVQKALVDLRVCAKARMFVGNFYSSFSRTVFEMRSLAEKKFLTY